jgi:hypothetical protein
MVVLLFLLLCLTMNHSTATAGEIGPVVTPAKGGMPRRNILVIYSQTVKYPWPRKVRDAFERSLENIPEAERPEVFEEYLDESRLREDAVGDFLADYLARKYRSVIFKAVLAETRDACGVLA